MHGPYVCQSSGELVADGVVVNRPCLLHCLVVTSSANNTAQAELFDNASAATGTEIVHLDIDPHDAAHTNHISFNAPVICNRGIYLNITGTNAAVWIYYSLL
jgi:hypothetical protein